jgi:hypothetical protein
VPGGEQATECGPHHARHRLDRLEHTDEAAELVAVGVLVCSLVAALMVSEALGFQQTPLRPM